MTQTMATNTYQTTAIPPLQFVRAYMIARHFQHAWATLMPPDIAYAGVGQWTRETITQYTLARDDEAFILGPDFDEFGNIIHTTGQHRLSWKVFTDGAVEMTVHRPQRDVYQVRISPERELELWQSEQVEACFRHIEVVFDFLKIFFSTWDADYRLREFWPRVVWDEEERYNRHESREPFSRPSGWFFLEEGKNTGGMRHFSLRDDVEWGLEHLSKEMGKHYTRVFPLYEYE